MLDLREAYRLKYQATDARDLAKRATLMSAMATKPGRCSVSDAITHRSPILTHFIPPAAAVGGGAWATPGSTLERPSTSPALLALGATGSSISLAGPTPPPPSRGSTLGSPRRSLRSRGGPGTGSLPQVVQPHSMDKFGGGSAMSIADAGALMFSGYM